MRSASRIAGVSIMTVMKLQVDVGEACVRFHDRTVRGLTPNHIQCDEAWSYCYAKDAEVSINGKAEYSGDLWNWVAIDPDTKMIVSWLVGPGRGREEAMSLMTDLRSRTAGPVIISTDALGSYKYSIESVFGAEATHRILSEKVAGTGYTSHVERYNSTTRTFVRRCARMGYGFSKKPYNHQMAMAMHVVWYNFCKPHGTLGPITTPAMAAGLAEFPMEIGKLLDLA